MSISDQRRLAQRDKVLLAARRCFVRQGFHATGMAELSKACRMSVGNIYHYFPNKDAIVRAIASEMRARIVPVLRRLEAHPDPLEGIMEIMRFSIRELCRGSDARLWIDISAEAPRNRLIRELLLDFDREIRSVLQGLLHRAVQAGQISRALEGEAAALGLVALLDGAIARVCLEPDIDIDLTLEMLARNVQRCLCLRPCA